MDICEGVSVAAIISMKMLSVFGVAIDEEDISHQDSSVCRLNVYIYNMYNFT